MRVVLLLVKIIQNLSTVGVILTAILGSLGFLSIESYLLPLFLLGSFLVLYDLDLPQEIIGEENRKLNILCSSTSVFFQLGRSGIVKEYDIVYESFIAIYIACLIVILLLIVATCWRKFNWRSGKLGKIYESSLNRELEEDADLLKKKAIIWGTIELPASEYVKALTLLSLAIEALLLSIVLSFFVTALGWDYSMELAMLILLLIWASNFLKDFFFFKWKQISTKKEVAERKFLGFIVSQLSNISGIYYLSLLIPVAAMALFSFAIIFLGLLFIIPELWKLQQQGIFWVLRGTFIWSSAIVMVIYMVYPLYLLVKLFQSNYPKISGKIQETSPLPYSSLLLSIIVEVIAFSQLSLLGKNDLGIYVFFAVLWVNLVLFLWWRHKKRSFQLTRKNKVMLSIEIGIYGYYPCIVLAPVMIPGMLLSLSLIGTVVKMLKISSGQSQSRNEKRVYSFAVVLLVAFELFLWLVSFYMEVPYLEMSMLLLMLLICIMVILLLPKEYSKLLVRKLLRVQIV